MLRLRDENRFALVGAPLSMTGIHKDEYMKTSAQQGGAMTAELMTKAIWGAGVVHLGIIAANIPLPRRLRVREHLAGVPGFIRQIFYVHWVYIIIVLGMFAGLCFGFARELAGGSGLGRFLSTFLAGFWLLRIVLQVFYYDREVRRENWELDLMYLGSLVVLVVIFGMAAVRPVR
jgi:hypothetical protein